MTIPQQETNDNNDISSSYDYATTNGPFIAFPTTQSLTEESSYAAGSEDGYSSSNTILTKLLTAALVASNSFVGSFVGSPITTTIRMSTLTSPAGPVADAFLFTMNSTSEASTSPLTTPSTLLTSPSSTFSPSLTSIPSLAPPPYATELEIRAGIHTFNRFYMPFVIIVGLLGNLLSILVFLLTKLRNFPSSHYLTALAVSDSGMLLCQLFPMFGFPANMFSCQGLIYVNNVFSFLSVWFVVSFTIERFIVVCYPLKRLSWCSLRRARTIIVGVTIAACLLNPYVWFLVRAVRITERGRNATMKCRVVNGHLWTMFTYVDTLLTLLVPMLLIVVLNVRIARSMWSTLNPSAVKRTANNDTNGGNGSCVDSGGVVHKMMIKKDVESFGPLVPQGSMINGGGHQRRRRPSNPAFLRDLNAGGENQQSSVEHHCNTSVSGQKSGGGCDNTNSNSNTALAISFKVAFMSQKLMNRTNNNNNNRNGNSVRDEKITKMLLVVSLVWVLMNLPDHVMKLISLYIETRGLSGSMSVTQLLRLQIARLCTNVLFQSNFAVNFFLYNVVGVNFRKNLKRLLLAIATGCSKQSYMQLKGPGGPVSCSGAGGSTLGWRDRSGTGFGPPEAGGPPSVKTSGNRLDGRERFLLKKRSRSAANFHLKTTASSPTKADKSYRCSSPLVLDPIVDQQQSSWANFMIVPTAGDMISTTQNLAPPPKPERQISVSTPSSPAHRYSEL